MEQVRAIILRAAGINTDLETQYTLELAGAKADRVHINRVIEDKGLLDQYHIAIFPGGFSYGDDVAAGKIMANQVVHHLAEPVRKFIDDGKLVLGICNGFQVLVKAGILPGGNGFRQEDVTITYNDSGRYEDRWVYLEPQTDRCVFIEPGKRIYVPIAHGEGNYFAPPDVIAGLEANRQVVFRYVDEHGEAGPGSNPNGSANGVAGICNAGRNVVGLMPHPERACEPTMGSADGRVVLQSVVKAYADGVIAGRPAVIR